MNGIVYCLSFPSGRKYVGSTTLRIETRIHCHRQQALVSKTPVYKCWRKEGEPKVNIIAILPVEHLFERERIEVEKLGSKKLNVAPGGMNGGFPGNHHAKGYRMPEEERQKKKRIMKGNNHRSGSLHSYDAKVRISESLKRTWAKKRGQVLGVKDASRS
jgi:hypothetical protein